MKFYFTKTPGILKKFYKNYTWNFSKKEKVVYLTFDDGPVPSTTPWVLDTLDKYQAKATFFCVGDNISKKPNIFKDIIKRGHAIGNHTYKHLRGSKTDEKTYIQDCLKTEELINKLILEELVENNGVGTIKNKALFRPPYGRITKKQADILISKGFSIIMWDVLSGDFDPKVNKEKCINNVMKNVKNGSIVVFHDSLKVHDKLKVVLPTVLAKLQAEGYSMKAI